MSLLPTVGYTFPSLNLVFMPMAMVLVFLLLPKFNVGKTILTAVGAMTLGVALTCDFWVRLWTRASQRSFVEFLQAVRNEQGEWVLVPHRDPEGGHRILFTIIISCAMALVVADRFASVPSYIIQVACCKNRFVVWFQLVIHVCIGTVLSMGFASFIRKYL
jgi:hypothetical protein